MKDYMMALRQRFCKEPECQEVRKQIPEVERDLRQAPDRRGQEKLLKLADLENKLQEEISPKVFSPDLNWRLESQAKPSPSASKRQKMRTATSS